MLQPIKKALKNFITSIVFFVYSFAKKLFRIVKNSIKIIIFLSLVFAVLMVTPYLSSLVLYFTNKIPVTVLSSTAKQPPKMIVTLGAGLRKKSDKSIVLNKYSTQRLKTTVKLYNEKKLPVLFSGVESKWVKAWLIDSQVPINQLILEKRSLNTCENINFTAIKLKELNINHIYLVTDAYHQQRARMNFAKQGIYTTSISASLGTTHKTLETSRLNFDNSRRSIYELIAIARDKYFPQSEKECRLVPKTSKNKNFAELDLTKELKQADESLKNSNKKDAKKDKSNTKVRQKTNDKTKS